jgi:hypothetical protein
LTFTLYPFSLIALRRIILMPVANGLLSVCRDTVHTDLSQRSPVTAGLQTQRPESQGLAMPAGSQSHLGSLRKKKRKMRNGFQMLPDWASRISCSQASPLGILTHADLSLRLNSLCQHRSVWSAGGSWSMNPVATYP